MLSVVMLLLTSWICKTRVRPHMGPTIFMSQPLLEQLQKKNSWHPCLYLQHYSKHQPRLPQQSKERGDEFETLVRIA